MLARSSEVTGGEGVKQLVGYLRMRERPLSDRPREKLLEKGAQALTDTELLGILLGSGTPRITSVDLAQNILKAQGYDLGLLARRSTQDLQQFGGVGAAKAAIIASAMELGKRVKEGIQLARPLVDNSKKAYDIMRSELMGKSIEEFWVILLNNANRLMAKKKISSGGLSSTTSDPRIIFKAVLEHHAPRCILVHNHPSGNNKPSARDVQLTKSVVAGASLLNICIADHIIFTDRSYYSFADNELVIR